MSIYLNISRVGRDEKKIIFSFKMAIKTAGLAQKIRVGRVSGNTAIFFFGLSFFSDPIDLATWSQRELL